jgi:ParB family chromosome partitioning protein
VARHDDFDDFFSDDEDTSIVDTRADGRLYRVPLARVCPNLVNPRTDFGTEDQLIDLGKSLARRQNQPCPVVSRGAYLKLWPEHADRIHDVDYVLVSGERRFRAATAVGLAALDCVANDGFATDRRTFMEAVVSENVDRQNFDPVEEAYAVQALVAEFGSNRAVAQHFERVDGWVTQRILLTHLAPDVQRLVRDKAIPLDAARQLGKLARDGAWDAARQLEWWEQEQQRRAEAAAARTAFRRAARQAAPQPAPEPDAPVPPQEPRFTAVKQEPAPDTRSPDPVPAPTDPVPMMNGSPHPPSGPGGDTVPEPRDAGTRATGPGPEREPEPEEGGRKPVRFPYNDGAFAAQLLIHRMPEGEFDTMLDALQAHRAQRHADAR